MNSSRNLIIALLALWCYAHNSNINLANNTTMLLILYALLNRGNLNCNGLNGTINSPRPNMQTPFGMPMNNSGVGSAPFPMF